MANTLFYVASVNSQQHSDIPGTSKIFWGHAALGGDSEVFSKYGATHPAAFFAAAAEAFFEKPRHLKRKKPDLYVQLAGCYRLDPPRGGSRTGGDVRRLGRDGRASRYVDVMGETPRRKAKNLRAGRRVPYLTCRW